MTHEYAPVVFTIYALGGAEGSVTVPAPRRFYRRWAMWIAVRLWIWSTSATVTRTVTRTGPVARMVGGRPQ